MNKVTNKANTHNILQQRSSTRIQIDQTVPASQFSNQNPRTQQVGDSSQQQGGSGGQQGGGYDVSITESEDSRSINTDENMAELIKLSYLYVVKLPVMKLKSNEDGLLVFPDLGDINEYGLYELMFLTSGISDWGRLELGNRLLHASLHHFSRKDSTPKWRDLDWRDRSALVSEISYHQSRLFSPELADLDAISMADSPHDRLLILLLYVSILGYYTESIGGIISAKGGHASHVHSWATEATPRVDETCWRTARRGWKGISRSMIDDIGNYGIDPWFKRSIMMLIGSRIKDALHYSTHRLPYR